MRTCVGCRKVVPAQELTRFTLVDGILMADLDQRRPRGGRGAWLHVDASCLAQARKRAAFSRSLRAKVNDSVLDDLSDQLG